MKKSILVLLILFASMHNAFSQNVPVSKTYQLVDLSGTLGSSRGTASLAYAYNWKLFKKQKWEIGAGLRFTSGFGVKQDYITAPAKLARTSTIPFLVVLSGQNVQNWDTLTVQRPLVNSLNLTANFGYNFNKRWSAGFNIDLVGFAFGRKTSAILKSNGITRTELTAKPANFNVLFTGDLDYGSLNSEYFVTYKVNQMWSVRAIYQFYFSEYKTTTLKQVAPDGTEVDRFRQKQNNFGLGISYHF